MHVMAMTMVAAGALQRRFHLVEADAAVAIGIELAENLVGRGGIGPAGAERILEFRLGDRSVAIGVDLREQIFQGIRRIGRRRVRASPRLAPRSARSWSAARSAKSRRRLRRCRACRGRRTAGHVERVGRRLALPTTRIDFEDVSDCRASRTDDTAPRAGNMIKLRQGRDKRGRRVLSGPRSASTVPARKTL